MFKKCIYVLILLCVVVSSSAQVSLSDLLKGKGKLKEPLKSPTVDVPAANQEIMSSSIICDAVAPALSIIREQYRLVDDTGNFYGKNNRPYYGETYTLGIKIPGALLLQRGVMFPWEKDNDFHRVNRDGKYKPEHLKTMQRGVNEASWYEVELDRGTDFIMAFTADSSIFSHIDRISDFGLPTSHMSGKQRGHMVWAYSSTDLKDSAMQVQLREILVDLDGDKKLSDIDIVPNDSANVLGGVLVVPMIERVGSIKVQLIAVASKNESGLWALNPVVAECVPDQKGDEKPTDTPDSPEPTPLE